LGEAVAIEKERPEMNRKTEKQKFIWGTIG
jgi:hypothetical protein